MDLTELRKSRGKNSIADIQKKITENNSGGWSKKEKDDRFWSLETDDAGNGSATIRFLPKRDDDQLPWVRIFNHAFKGPTGKWYIENSLSTIGKTDPVGEHNSKLWATGTKENQDIVRNQKRNTKYICNVLVVRDSKNPGNEGKVFLFKFGPQIFEIISDKINPKFEDDDPIDVFDIWEGANFKLKIYKKDNGYSSFDKSEFQSVSELADGDEDDMLKALNSRFLLSEFVAEDQFKSYEDLKKRLDYVLGDGTQMKTAEEESLKEAAPVKEERKPVEKAEPTVKAKPAVNKAPVLDDEEDEDEMAFFKKNMGSDPF